MIDAAVGIRHSRRSMNWVRPERVSPLRFRVTFERLVSRPSTADGDPREQEGDCAAGTRRPVPRASALEMK